MSDNYDIWISVDQGGSYTYADLILPDAGRIHYTRVSSGTSYIDAVFEATSSPGAYYGSKITWISGVGWHLVMKDGTQMSFGGGSMLAAITDRNGNTVQVQRGSGSTRIVSPHGRWISLTYDGLTYDGNGRVDRAQDNTGRTVWYAYSGGHLSKFYDANGGVTSYSYDSAGRMVSFTTPNGNVHANNQYDSNGRVVRQTQPDGGQYNFSYLLDGNGKVTETDMTDPRGSSCNLTFDSKGYPLSDTWAVGKPEQQATTYNRDSNTELLNSTTDTLGRTTAFTHDARGNTTSITRLSGTGSAATTSLAYDSVFNQLTGITDPLGHVWTLTLDADGNVTGVTDPLSHATTLTYNGRGQPISLTDPNSNAIHFAYSAGMLSSITDALGHTTNLSSDGAGRLVSLTDPLGHPTSYGYDQLDDLTQIVDGLGAMTQFSYDHDRNLLSVTDANGNTTSYTYDAMDRRVSRTDALGATENYAYDGDSNLISHTDRRGKVTVYQYDGLNRRTFDGFGRNGSNYESTINYTWDGGNRLTQAVDSIAGIVSRSYNGLDRLTDEQSPQGGGNYSYDAAGRRSTMQVVGQSQVGYAWDNGNRLSGITQGTSSVGFNYDNGNRRTTLTLPNGVTMTYGYDGDSRITQLAYGTGGSGSNDIGTLTYEYDADGRVTSKGGTLAATGMPSSVSGNSFNADNAATAFGGQALAYDANGNMTSDGANSYTWDARNHLIGISGGANASFVYDAFGRRTSKNIGGTTTQFLYDGLNSVQELDGSNPPNLTATLLNGLNIDERFTRTGSGGTANFLTDNLGSVAALANSSGSIATSYNYEPFGNTTSSGASNANPYQFTGRENDGTGLYFYRARYYSPTFQRFIGQDPIGFSGGDANLYAYALNSPTNLRDPSGRNAGVGVIAGASLCPECDLAVLVALGGVEAAIIIHQMESGGDGKGGAQNPPPLPPDTAQPPNDPNDPDEPKLCRETPNGTRLTQHAQERALERQISGDDIDQALSQGIETNGNTPGTTQWSDIDNNVTVVVNQSGDVVTVRPGGPSIGLPKPIF